MSEENDSRGFSSTFATRSIPVNKSAIAAPDSRVPSAIRHTFCVTFYRLQQKSRSQSVLLRANQPSNTLSLFPSEQMTKRNGTEGAFLCFSNDGSDFQTTGRLIRRQRIKPTSSGITVTP
ncbi:hypothetical protein BaRGS_00024414, partial [Batillaria attramentaria]